MGTVHYYSAICALFFGTWVLLISKGNKQHKTIGLYYVIAMSIMLFSSFMSYRFNGTFNLFHYASIASSLTLISGMFPIWLKKPNHNYKILHMHFMYWSLIGLYMGFVAEIFTRIPGTPFYSMVAIASSTVFLLGVMGFKHKMPEWERKFGNHKSVTTTA